jgi:hypothetical protein
MSWYKQGKLATSIIFDFSVLFQNYNQVSSRQGEKMKYPVYSHPHDEALLLDIKK